MPGTEDSRSREGELFPPKVWEAREMDVPWPPGDVLAQPTRARLFALLGTWGRSASTDELADELGLHPNGVRLHLERLRAAGLVLRDRERIARGRPRDLWSISPHAAPGGDRPSAYADLSRWLVRAIREGGAARDGLELTGRAIGREIAREISPRGRVGAPEPAFRTVLAAMGFRPRSEPGPPGTRRYCLDNCPYRDAVPGHRDVVCTLHRGMTAGLLDVLDSGSVLTGFRPEDPYAAGCGIEIRGLDDPSGAPARS